mmetsp:Transcript_17259/g.25327  ORF Transcript_17259/g.25327 Transcript_17259/m.25327 type:complete len:531 (-) Transcript_17259:64-1656(-)
MKFLSASVKFLFAWSICSIVVFHYWFIIDSASFGDSIYGINTLDFKDIQEREQNDIQELLTGTDKGYSRTNGGIASVGIKKPKKREQIRPVVSESDEEIVITPTSQKPALVLHVGPQKTGSTSVQLNVIRSKIFRPLLKKDHYQEIVGFEYQDFDKLRKKCLDIPEKCDYSYWNHLKTEHRQAYNNTAAGKQINAVLDGNNKTNADEDLPIYTLHTNEEWALLPHSQLTFSLLKELFEPWNSVHVIIFYRPVMDWLPSMYKQYRKYLLYRPRSLDTPWKEGYQVKRNEQMTFPAFLRDLIESDRLRDTLATFEFYQQVLSQLKNHHKINIMQTYAPDDEIEREFLCKLPGATKSCSHMNTMIDYKWNRMNKLILPLNLDLVIVEAWHQNLVSIKRHSAAVALEEKMKALNITITEMPQICISKDEEEWLWNRTLVSEKLFGKSAFIPNTYSSDKATESSALRSKFENALSQKKYCSVNATAVLEIERFRSLFDDCKFHSPHYLTRALMDGKPNPKWTELGCSNTDDDKEE